MTGRPPKPTRLKVLSGKPGHRPLPKREPKPLAVQELACPDWMPPLGRERWARLAPLLARTRVLTEADQEALELLCDSWAEWQQARAVVRELGPTCEGSHGGTVARPECALADRAQRRVMQLLARFGLSPSDRARVQTTGEDQERDPMDELLAERGA